MTDLVELAKRCEAATGPSRALDHDIAVAIGARASNGAINVAAMYTGSLDSAMTLVSAECDPLGILEAAIESARDAQDGVYYLPLHITAAALRALAAQGEG